MEDSLWEGCTFDCGDGSNHVYDGFHCSGFNDNIFNDCTITGTTTAGYFTNCSGSGNTLPAQV